MPSIGVLEHFQKVTDQPTRRVKRSGGQSLVNQGAAEWVIKNILLQMRPEREYIDPPDNGTLIMEYSGISTRRWEWRGKVDKLPVRDWKENLLLSYPIADQRSNPAY